MRKSVYFSHEAFLHFSFYLFFLASQAPDPFWFHWHKVMSSSDTYLMLAEKLAGQKQPNCLLTHQWYISELNYNQMPLKSPGHPPKCLSWLFSCGPLWTKQHHECFRLKCLIQPGAPRNPLPSMRRGEEGSESHRLPPFPGRVIHFLFLTLKCSRSTVWVENRNTEGLRKWDANDQHSDEAGAFYREMWLSTVTKL